MITCSRCGKENQDHYKFCLGCGNEMKSAAKAAAVVRDPLPIETAKTIAPPDSDPHERTDVGVGSDPNVMTPPPVITTPKARGGIPWNDSPRMGGLALTPAPVSFVASGPVTPAPVVSGQLDARPAANSPWAAPQETVVPSVPVLQKPIAATPLGNPVLVTDASPATVTCGTCGRSVTAGFAFCGSCGTRIASASASASAPASSAATNGQRTMFMSAPAKAVVPRGRLILIRPDGTEGGAHPLHDGENLVGRGQGGLFDGDLYLSPRHAEFVLGPDGLVVRDVRSLNGVFFRIGIEELLESGDVIRIGQELLRFEVISAPGPLEDGTEVAGTPNPGFWGRLSVVVGRDVDGSAFPLFGDAVVLGRERGDILFPEDGYVSGTHARFTLRDERVYLSDAGSSNGTFLRVRGERKVPSGSFILMGQQLFRLEYR